MEIFPRSGGVHEPFEFVAQGHPGVPSCCLEDAGEKVGPRQHGPVRGCPSASPEPRLAGTAVARALTWRFVILSAQIDWRCQGNLDRAPLP